MLHYTYIFFNLTILCPSFDYGKEIQTNLIKMVQKLFTLTLSNKLIKEETI